MKTSMYTLLSILTFISLGGAGNYDGDWTNSQLSSDKPGDFWPLYLDSKDFGKVTGFFQLRCSDARSSDPKWSTKEGQLTLDICEQSCRCNAWGEYMISPIENSDCNQDMFLDRCIQGAKCKCAWVQQGHTENNLKTPGFRQDQLNSWQANKGKTPPQVNHGDELK
ncbi:hypothetical protein TWF694_008142 [Orbilia ellipsospora]|uniref:Uncharacterized protein n=1 Tax=Orbilia ellipsospora TaxID=2528407 RepID=A0AAV9XFM1_9PEZI